MRKYVLTIQMHDNGQLEVSAQNTGIAPLEIIGILEMHKNQILSQLNNNSTTISIPGAVPPDKK